MKNFNKNKKITIESLFNELMEENNIEKKTTIITHIIQHSEKPKNVSNFNLRQLFNKANHFLDNNKADKLILWGKYVYKLFEIYMFVPKSEFQLTVFKIVFSQNFSDDELKYNLIYSVTKKDGLVNNIDNRMLESIVLFILINKTIKISDENYESLTLIKSLKISLEKLSYPLCELFIHIMTCLAMYHNIQYYKRQKSHKERDPDCQFVAKQKICYDFLMEAFEKKLITKNNHQTFIIFLIVFLTGFIEEQASKYYMSLAFKYGQTYQRELMNLIDRNKDNIKEHLIILDSYNRKIKSLIELISNPNDSNNMINNFSYFNKAFVLLDVDYSTFIEKKALKMICKLWKDQVDNIENDPHCNDIQDNGFVMPHDKIWEYLTYFSTDNYFCMILLDNIANYIAYFGETARNEWEYIFEIIDNIIYQMISLKLQNSSTPEDERPSRETNKMAKSVKKKTIPLFLNNDDCDSLKETRTVPEKSNEKYMMKQDNKLSMKFENIFDLIYQLEFTDKFKGDIEKFVDVLFKYPEPLKERLNIRKIKLILFSHDTFFKYIEQLLNENINSSTVNKYTLLTIIDIIKEFYHQIYDNEKYASKIEAVLQKYHEKILKLMENNNSKYNILSSYSLFIIDILILTHNNNFFEDIINKTLRFNATEIIDEFMQNTIRSLMKKLILLFAKDKLLAIFRCFNNKMNAIIEFSNDNMTKNTSFILAIIKIFKQFYVNHYYEVHMNKDMHGTGKISCLISFHPSAYLSSSTKEICCPYQLINFSTIFDFCLFFIDKEQSNKTIVNDILSLLNKQLKYMFLLRSFKLSSLISKYFLDQFANESKIIALFVSQKEIFRKIYQIICFANYHINNPSLDNLPLDIKNEKTNFNTIIQNLDMEPLFKLKIIGTLLECLNQKLSFMIDRILSVNLCSLNERPIQTDDGNNKRKNLGSDFEDYLELATNLFNLLEFYLFSLTNFDIKTQSKSMQYFSVQPDASNKNNKTSNQSMINAIKNYFKLLKKCKEVIPYDTDLSFLLIKTIFMLKELLSDIDQDHIIEIIYLLLYISWHQYQKNWTEEFKKEYNNNINYIEKQEQSDYQIDFDFKQAHLVERFGDAVVMYFFEKVTERERLLRLIQKVFQNPSSKRQIVFLDLCKWHLTSRTNRDNIRNQYRWKEPSNSDVYYDNKSMISVIPIDSCSCELIVRSSIANVDMTISGNHSIWKKEDDYKLDALLKTRNKNKKFSRPSTKCTNSLISTNNPTEDLDSNCIEQFKFNDNNTYSKKRDYLFLSFYRQLSVDNFTIKPYVFPPGTIQNIDSSSVYILIDCGLIYYPNNSCIDSSVKLLSYNGPISLTYLTFIKSLGQTFPLNEENKNICSINSVCKNKEGLYAIYNQDIVYQLIYYCTNLLCPMDYESIVPIRKSLINPLHFNIIWMDNPFMKFNPTIIESSAIVYIVIYPYAASHYFIKLKFSKNTKENNDCIKELIKKNLQTKVTIHIDTDCKKLANYLRKIIIIMKTIITFGLKKNINDEIIRKNKQMKEKIANNCLNCLEDNNWCSRYEKINKEKPIFNKTPQ